MNPVSFANPIRPQQKGYIYIWVSNESENTKVWFDDLKVTHRSRRVTQATDYYAYGSVLREQKTPEELTYRYKYQGQYAEKDEETGWSHFELREYYAIIGRWTSKDPVGQYWSPYVGMGNDPVNRTDPDGGLDDYEMDKKGNITLVKTTTDNFDRLFNHKGNLIADNIDKGILRNNINISLSGLMIDINSITTRSSVLDFTESLSKYVKKEISGYGLQDASNNLVRIKLERYKDNKTYGANSVVYPQGVNIPTLMNGSIVNLTAKWHFHTHPGGYKGGGLVNPSPADLKHLQLTNGLPHIILGGQGGISNTTLFNGTPQTLQFQR